MASQLPVLDVTARDFDALVEVLQNRSLVRFPDLPQTDFNISNFTQVMIDLFAGVGDGLNFYIDNVAQDLFWESVRRRENAIRLGALIGYRLASASAARATIRFQLSQPALGDVTFPIRTQVKTNDPNNPLVFETLVEAIIPAGNLFVDVLAENAQLKTQNFTSDGTPSQAFQLDETPYVQGSASVKVGVNTWAEVEDFFNSKTIDEHFVANVDSNDRLEVEFGDGSNGAIPLGDIEVQYKIGGGVQGQVFANTITVLDSTFTDQFSNPVNVTATNFEEAQGGTDRESLAEARFKAPRSVKTNQRTIAREDFEINAQEVAGISRARVFTADDDALIPENTGFLYVVPTGGGVPSLALRDQVYDYLTKVKPVPIGFVLNVVGPTYVAIGFTMKVFVRDASFKTAVRAALDTAFNEYFSETILSGDNAGQPNPLMDFEKKFFNSEIISIAQAVHTQLRNVELITDLETLYNLDPAEFPVRGVVSFEDGDTGLPLE